MRFDIIIGNPPYHLNTNDAGQGIPIYQKFVEQALELKPKYLSMIIPSKWFAGGMKTLDDFRQRIMKDRRIKELTDFTNAKECFPANSIAGGVCYFLWDSSYDGKCLFTNVNNGVRKSEMRYLDDFAILVRQNEAVDIIKKIQNINSKNLSEIVSPLCPFGFTSSDRGAASQDETNNIRLIASSGDTFVSIKDVKNGIDLVEKYKIMIGILGAEHALEADKDGKYRIITSSMKVLKPNEVCTHSYFVVGNFSEVEKANSLYSYLKTKFVRFLILMAMTSTHLSKSVFVFVPYEELDRIYDDQYLYKKYNLTDNEVNYIESLIKEM